MALEVPESRAKASKARGSLKDEAKAKAKHKAKVEDTEALRSRPMTRTMTRTKTGPAIDFRNSDCLLFLSITR